ncbi:MAG: hypothetical protein KA123_00390 [Candidatus Eisenbacteria bacterium]|nr:hypothetical protein [Candidatus Eisenbacteria bacterium]
MRGIGAELVLRAATRTARRAATLAILPAITLAVILSAAAVVMPIVVEAQVPEGVPRITNGAKPSQGTETWKLEKLWSAGGEEGEVIFGLITQALVDDAGDIYLLDSQLSEVKVFSPVGKLKKTLSREGEGPGEVRGPTDLFFLPDGQLGLVQLFPGKVITIDRNGNPGTPITIGGADPTAGGFVVLLDGASGGGNLYFAGLYMTMENAVQNRTSFLARFSPQGVEQVRYLEKKSRLDLANIEIVERDQHFVYPRRWAASGSGEVFAAPEIDRYAIYVYRPDGTMDRVIEREFTPRPRTAKELERLDAVVQAQTRQLPGTPKYDFEKTEPAISGLNLRSNGELWVTSSRSGYEQPKGIMLTYDVFNAAGKFIKQVAVACDGDGLEDGLFFAGDDRMLLVRGMADAGVALQGGAMESAEGEEAAPMEVVLYRITH